VQKYRRPLRFPYITRARILQRLDATTFIVCDDSNGNGKGNANGLHHGLHLHRAHARVFRRNGGIAPFLRGTHGQRRQAMNWVYWLSGLAALGIFVYLLIALFKPEFFS
jgi:F subunit of K+-transporting ATPase (Potass_KdpF)